ncbi:hypothetical protein MKX01_000152 [Papaver californicum]|nr:hypothetical protein MKX01_000152 [Papaver californicum]
MKDNLYATSLCFRLLRQHGFQVSQDVFSEFQNARGDFEESLASDVKGMLSLYEAARLLSEGESIQHEAIVTFTKRHLINNNTDDDNLAKQVSRSLEIPFHWRMQRSEARWFIDVYEYQRNMNPLLLELAKMNFNMWWKSLGIVKNLSFARDRLVECFLGSIGFSWEPKYERCREWLTKTISFVWDCKMLGKLPHYMKICFLALYNTTNTIGTLMYEHSPFRNLANLRATKN